MAKKKAQELNSAPLHDSALAGGRIQRSTQKYIDIAEIKNDIVVLKNGAIRAVLSVTNVNFALLAEEEQEAIILGYQSFLNSLDFPIQIVVQSRILDIDPYLRFLEQNERKQINELLREQTREYRFFIEELVEDTNVMEKRFYIVVPFSLGENTQIGFFAKIRQTLRPEDVVKQKKEKFERYRTQLMQRVANVQNALGGMGISARQLNTRQLIELYYGAYNPRRGRQPSMGDLSKLEIQGLEVEEDEKEAK